jgi:tripartite-type tricarboxylate transporter receptor subunit TctC
MTRRGLGQWIAGYFAAMTALSPPAFAYPDRPVRLVVPFSAGSSVDIMVRAIGDALAKDIGQPVIIENKAGAGGNLAADYVSRQAPDGYTLYAGTTGNLAVAKSLYGKLSYDPQQAFTPVSMGWVTWNVLIVPAASPLRTVQDMIAAAKAAPGQLNYGTPGVGTSGHIVMEWLAHRTGTRFTPVHYKGQNEVVNDLYAKRLDLSLETSGSAIPALATGQVRPLAVTAATRLELLPEVATFKELGIEQMETNGWSMFVVPAKTPLPIVQRLNDGLVKAMSTPSVRDRINRMGVLLSPSAPQAAARFHAAEIEKWGRIIRTIGVQIN